MSIETIAETIKGKMGAGSDIGATVKFDCGEDGAIVIDGENVSFLITVVFINFFDLLIYPFFITNLFLIRVIFIVSFNFFIERLNSILNIIINLFFF